MSPTIAQLILEASATLREAGVAEPRLDAGVLLAHVIQRDRTFIITHSDDSVRDDLIAQFQDVIARRASGEPVQYITGHQEFFGLDFEVSDAVLIPRPETELLVETAIELLRSNDQPFICDVGTGSGCIAIAVLHEVPTATALAIDVSEQALEVAKRNAQKHAVADRITFLLSDCFAALTESHSLDMVVSNPPYVGINALGGLQREVREYEPRVALTPGGDGLAIIERLVREAPGVLKPRGYLLLEIGFDQRDKVLKLVNPGLWNIIDVHKDLQGIPRTVVLQKL